MGEGKGALDKVGLSFHGNENASPRYSHYSARMRSEEQKQICLWHQNIRNPEEAEEEGVSE